jgi:hypothetical protein
MAEKFQDNYITIFTQMGVAANSPMQEKHLLLA